MNQKERMLAGLPYKSWLDGLETERTRAKSQIHRYNRCKPQQQKKMEGILRSLLGSTGNRITIEPPLSLSAAPAGLYVRSPKTTDNNITFLDDSCFNQ